MKTLRVMMGLMCLALLLIVAPLSLAQDDMTFGLSQEDFTTWTQANAMSASATSASFDFTITSTITGVPDAGGPIDINLTGTGLYDTTSQAFQMTLGGTLTAQGQEMPADLEVRVVDGAIYFNSPSMTGGQWQGATLEEVQSMAGSQLSGALPVDPAGSTGDPMADMMNMEGMNELMASLAAIDPQSFISMSRNGEQFSTNVDLGTLVESEAFGQFVMQAMAMSGQADTANMTEAQMEGAMAMFGSLLQDSVVQLDQYVGADNMINRTTITLGFNIDPTQLGETGEAVVVDFVFDINLSGYNQAYTVEVPEGAMMMSESMGS